MIGNNCILIIVYILEGSRFTYLAAWYWYHFFNSLKLTFLQHLLSKTVELRILTLEHWIVPSENCDVVERNFRVFAQPRNFCYGAQLSRNFGRFRAVFALIIFHFGEIWGQIAPLSTRNHSFSKFVAACPKLAASCFHTSFHFRCHWARVARLMTLQRSLQ